MSAAYIAVATRLPDLAVARPQDAMIAARAILDRRCDHLSRSYAHQARGIVLRDSGQLVGARRALSAARRHAEASGDANRVADVCASLGAMEVLAGRTDRGLRILAEAGELAMGAQRTRVLVRNGIVLAITGRHDEAIRVLTIAIAASRRQTERTWAARALLARSSSYLAVGWTARARRDARRAETLFETDGLSLEVAKAVHTRALVAFADGVLIDALELFARAEQDYAAVGVDVPELAEDRCRTLIAAGLAADAVAETEAALQRPATRSARSQLMLASAAAALEAGHPEIALVRATRAERAFRGQGRFAWAVLARLVRITARSSMKAPTRTLAARAAAVAVELTELGSVHARSARLLAGQLLLFLDADAAREQLRYVSEPTARTALQRIERALARAYIATLDDSPAAVLRACGSGLIALAEHRLAFGSAELQALAGHSGRRLVELAMRAAAETGNPHVLLRSAELIRASSRPDERPPTNARLRRELAVLRDVTRRVEHGDGRIAAALERERSRCEQAVRREQRVLRSGGLLRLDLSQLSARLGRRCLVEFVVVGVELHAVVVDSRSTSRCVGVLSDVIAEVGHARAALRRAVHGRDVDLVRTGADLERSLLAGVADLLGDEPVIVPCAQLAGAPWGLLPRLRDTAFSVTSSAMRWLSARRSDSATIAADVLVTGPDLDGDELATLVEQYPHAVVLRGPAATATEVVAAIDGARLAHIAAHGTFRMSNPLFSSLRMWDGPLTGYDLQGLRRAPRRIVLAACDAGASALVGEDTSLGLADVLVARGAHEVMAPVVAVPDTAMAEVARAIHVGLAGGETMRATLRSVRGEAVGGSVAATSAAFVAVNG